MIPTPVSLLARLRAQGETRAWGQFVDLYSPILFGWARRAGLQEADAADLVQDVFAALVRALPGFDYDPARGFRNWLKAVAMNKLRERARRPAAAGGNGDRLDDLPAPPDTDPFWEAEYRQQVTRRLLEVMRRDFEPHTWRACWACVVDGRAAADVGAELGLSAGAVRAAKFRVLARLRDELRGLLD